MSDIRKWMQLLSEDSIEQGSAVKLSDDFGGGIGTFDKLSEDNPEVAIVNVKGNNQEVPLTSLQKVLDQSREYDEDPCYNITPDLFEPGTSVRVKNLWGSGTGDGYGIFINYSTDGQTAIVNVDSEERSVPVDLVYPANEQEAKDDFQSSGSDGSESPFTSAGDNVQDNQGRSKMSDMERWISAVSESNYSNDDEKYQYLRRIGSEEISKGADPKQVVLTLAQQHDLDDLEQQTLYKELTDSSYGYQSEDCDCGDYECTTCFPLSEDEISGYSDLEDNESEEEDLVELDIDDSKYYQDADEEDLEDQPEPRVGDSEGESEQRPGEEPEDFASQYNDDLPDAAYSAGSIDVSELIGKIDYVQNMGMSMSDKHYDTDKLINMRPGAVARIYSKVTGEEVDESLEERSMSASFNGDAITIKNDGNPTEIDKGDTVFLYGEPATYQGVASRRDFLKLGKNPTEEDSVLLDMDGDLQIVPVQEFIYGAEPAELVETSAGGVAIAAGMGKVLDSTGIYEAASIDPAEVKSLEKMDVESAKSKAAEIIQNSRTSDKRKAKLIQNVGKANSVVKVLQLMYNLLLAGDGLSTTDSKWQKKYDEAVDNDQDMSELSRVRELAGLPNDERDDGVNSGAVTPEDFEDLFWDYWDRSSPSSQHQYLTAVYGEQADIEDFSDAAAKTIENIKACEDPAVVDKQLHMLRRIGMPLYSICPDTGMFYPA